MESRSRVLLLTRPLAVAALALTGASGCASLQQSEQPPVAAASAAQPSAAQAGAGAATPAPRRVIEPQVERRTIARNRIDTENFELGLWYGVLGVEDFGTNPAYGIKAAYHVTEDFFFEGDVGRSTLGKSSLEALNPGSDPLGLDGDRRLTYYSLSLGYNFLPGEAFVGRNLAMNSAFYVLAGIGAVNFADEDRFSVNFGAGYRVLPTDWLTLHFDVQDRVFETDLFGSTKLTNNLEARIGITAFF